MTLADSILKSFTRSFQLYDDLLSVIEEKRLSQNLQPHRSNTLGEQLWCVTGARESYAAAIAKDQWAGFQCSLQTTNSHKEVTTALQHSAEAVQSCLTEISGFTSTQNRLMLDLLEHEAAHHGQIIRYIYALNLPVPDSWKKKYALQDS